MCTPYLPLPFLCDGPWADLWWWWREGKKRSRGAHLHLITLRLLAPYKTLHGAVDPSDTRTATPRKTERTADLFSVFMISISWSIKWKNKQAHQELLLHRLIGINSFHQGFHSRFFEWISLLGITLHCNSLSVTNFRSVLENIEAEDRRTKRKSFTTTSSSHPHCASKTHLDCETLGRFYRTFSMSVWAGLHGLVELSLVLRGCQHNGTPVSAPGCQSHRTHLPGRSDESKL